MKKTIILFFCLLSLFEIKANNDSTAIERLSQFVKNIQVFNYNYPQEKVYLHFDNTGYFIGETIWFKAYSVMAEDNLLTDLSRVLYVELLDNEGELLETKKLKLENGQCHDGFILKPEYSSAFYEVRAYTRSMLNFGEEFIFSRVFPVFETPENNGDYKETELDDKAIKSSKNRKTDIKRDDINITFYPEGGNLVRGLKSRVAFKATDKQGNDLSLTGKIYTVFNEAIADFSTEHHGMGVFEITAEENLKASVVYNGKTYHFALPQPLSSTYVLSVDTQEKNLYIEITKSAEQPNDTLGLSIACRGKVYSFSILDMNENRKNIVIPESTLPVGVNNITLFDQKGEVFAERLIFVYRPSEVRLSVRSDKEIYNPFDKIEIQIETKQANGSPVSANLSLSVKDAASSFEEFYPDHIYSNLLLSSELKGYIKYPSYYFQSDDPVREKHLDLLMMVHGWRRYEWKRMAGLEDFEIKHPLEDGLLINGTILHNRTRRPEKNMPVTMWMNDKEESFSGRTTSNEDGTFAFSLDTKEIYGKTFLGLSTSSKGEVKASRIALDRLFSPEGKYYPDNEIDIKNRFYFLPELKTEEERQRSLSEMQILKEVVIKKSRRQATGGPDIVYDVEGDLNKWLDQGEKLPLVVWEYLMKKECMYDIYAGSYRGRPASLSHTGKKDTRRRIERDYYTSKEEREIAFYDNKVNIYIKEVYKIAIYIPSPPRPVNIIFYLYDDGVTEFLPDGVRHTYFQGYSKIKEFSAPDYGKNPPIPGKTDYRRTLYWNPNVKTDATGKANVDFYNNSSRTKLIIDCEGITNTGGLMY